MSLSEFTFKEKWSYLKNTKIYVGLSGGVDSVVLLRLFSICGFDVEALHVNYQLRGEESDGDEVFVRSLCEKLGVPLSVKTVSTEEKSLLEKRNLQAVARTIRYDFFQCFLNQNHQSVLAIAHHKDDQIETFFLNLARKSGIRGLACMLEKDKNKIRPFLTFSKEEIIQFAKKNDWEWREDQSNQSLKYKRNFLRNKYIPEMLNEVPSLELSVLTLVAVFQNELKSIQESLHHLNQSVQSSGFLLLKDFEGLTQNQQIELLFMLGFNASELQAFYKIMHVQKGKFIKTKNLLRVFKEKEGFSFEKFHPIIDFEIKVNYVDELPRIFNKHELYFDADLIQGALKLRKWQNQDRIYPIGMRGSKLISDVLLDAKINAIERVQWYVLVDDEEVLACPLFSVSRTKIARKDSKKIMCVKLLKNDLRY